MTKLEKSYETVNKTTRGINKLKKESIMVEVETIGFIIGFMGAIIISIIKNHKKYSKEVK